MVAVRSTGYSFDAIVGYQNDAGDNVALVDEAYLRTLVGIANERFQINEERIARFRAFLMQEHTSHRVGSGPGCRKPGWEDAEVRKQRKREEGLVRQKALREKSNGNTAETLDTEMSNTSHQVDLEGMFDS